MYAVSEQDIVRSIITGTTITFLLILLAVTTWLIPLPLVFYRIKLGRKHSLFIPAATILILLILSKGFTPEIAIYTGLMGLGFMIGECFEKQFSIEKTILLPALAVVLTGCIALLFYSTISGTGIYDHVSIQLDNFLKLVQDSGVVIDTPDEFKRLILWSLPGTSAVLILFVTWVNVLLAAPVFNRGRLAYPDFGPTLLWKAPEQLVWLAIGSGAGLLLPVAPLKLISINIFMVVSLIYFFQGIAIISFYMNRVRLYTPLKLILYWLIFFQFPINLLVSAAGLFDMWIDFRKIAATPAGKADN